MGRSALKTHPGLGVLKGGKACCVSLKEGKHGDGSMGKAGDF